MLSKQHQSELNASRISEDYIMARGYRTLDADERDELKDLRIPNWSYKDDSAFPGLLIPMYRATGELVSHQFKPAIPQEVDGKKRKYASPVGTSNHLDVHPFSLATITDTDVPLWITEGAKKSDSLASRGVCALTLTGVWNWRDKMGTLGDWEDVPLKGRAIVICFDADAKDNRMVMMAMKRFGAWLVSKKARAVYYLVVPEEVDGTPVKGVDDFFAAGGTLDQLKESMTKTVPGENTKDAAFTDTFLSERAAGEALEGRYTWAHGLGWMKWDGTRWAESNERTVMEAMRMWAMDQWRGVMRESLADPQKDLKTVIDSWRGVQSVGRLSALLKLSAGILETEAAEFDNDPDILNCPNGVVDLRTGELMEVDPSRLMTKVAGCNYIPGATHSDWATALEAIPESLREWYQIRVGQAITGYMTPDDLLVITQGGGANGKSTINEGTAKAAGDYFLLVSDRALMANPDAHPTELMDFKGARYAVLEETPEARRLDPQRLKRTVGTPTITARKIRQDSVTFQATHSLFLSTNHRPVVDETDHGTWRRLALVRFPYTFRKPHEPITSEMDKRGDGSLRGRITTDPRVHEAILAWMVEGAQKWYALRKVMPELPDVVQADTLDWRANSDPILGFVQDELVFDPDSHIEATEMLEEMNSWLKGQGYSPWAARTFATRFGGHDSVSTRRVTKQEIRHRPGLSTRRPWDKPKQKCYAWVGVRFASEQGEQASVAVVASTKVNGLEEPYTRVNLSSCDNGDNPKTIKPLAFDLETCSVDEMFTRSDFVRLSAATGLEPSTDHAALLNVLNRAESITGHNILGFDLLALARHHGAQYEALAAKAVDTMLIAKQLDPPSSKGMPAGYYSLDSLCERYGVARKTDDIKRLARKHGGFDQIPLDNEEYVEYLRGDVTASEALVEAMGAPDAYVQREHRVQAVMGRISLSGFRVDEELCWDRHQRGADKLDEIKDRLHREHDFPVKGAAPHRTTAGKEAFYNALRAAGLGPQWIEKEWPKNKDGSLSLAKEVLAEKIEVLSGPRPVAAEICEAILRMNGVRTVYGNVIDWTVNGRVHPSINPEQASGRWSVTKPGLTVMGKRNGKHVEREIFLPEPGHVIVAFDLDQVDMRAIAGHCQDAAYMELFAPGRDVHSEVAKMVGLSREEAKAIGHGWNYGLGVAGQVRGGVREEAAVQFDRRMRENFPRLVEWKDEVRALAGAGELLDNGFGRKLRVHPDWAYTQAPAQMGQGTTRDILAEGLLRLPSEIVPMLRVVVHDEIVLSIPKDSLEDVSRQVQEALTFEFKGVPITCGASKAGDSWGSCYSK